ncbi:TetR/AcrR family transcriptional regulator [Nesterenkonia marinintestina]|uniref:TetR/AcrR family transcriptional regulator n=1 Tax=Nesterenkonia marinintestina TaxID=2979865 RepID=UPI0021BE61AD|nr:TetR-like C-terminal domain-containing protein [Nesterenkonia sp. GX14115]
MPRAGLTRDTVISAARRLIDETPDPLTLAALSAALGVRTPSLYKHVAGLDDLHAEVGVAVKHELLDVLADAVAGRSGDEAVRRLASAYRSWALRNPRAYPYTLKAADHASASDLEVSARLLHTLTTALRGHTLGDDDEVHAVRGLRALLHGFVSLELEGGFALPQAVDESFDRAVESFLRSLPS